MFTSLRRRHDLTPVLAEILNGLKNGLNQLPEERFEFPFNLIGKSTMAFLTGQSWRVLKSWSTGGT